MPASFRAQRASVNDGRGGVPWTFRAIGRADAGPNKMVPAPLGSEKPVAAAIEGLGRARQVEPGQSPLERRAA